ncbi:hypothetical protein AMTRI_Chr01g113440 [Amborella trichopoda]
MNSVKQVLNGALHQMKVAPELKVGICKVKSFLCQLLKKLKKKNVGLEAHFRSQGDGFSTLLLCNQESCPSDTVRERNSDEDSCIFYTHRCSEMGGDDFMEKVDERAEAYIAWFWKRIMIEKQNSFKRCQEMLAKGT